MESRAVCKFSLAIRSSRKLKITFTIRSQELSLDQSDGLLYLVVNFKQDIGFDKLVDGLNGMTCSVGGLDVSLIVTDVGRM